MTAPSRARIDPATKAQAALDVRVRKLATLDLAIIKARAVLTGLMEQRPLLADEVDYLADHPALKVDRGATP